MSHPDDFQQEFNRQLTPLLQSRDQRVAEMRDLYQALDAIEKEVLRARLTVIAEASKGALCQFAETQVRIRTNENTAFRVLPTTLLKAVDAWDRGEEFVSNSLQF